MALSRAAMQGTFNRGMFARNMVRGGTWGALSMMGLMVVVGCGAAQDRTAIDQSAAATESAPPTPAVEAPTCVGEKDEAIECLSDSDCCPGFVCGKDPERSQHSSYCIYGG